MNITDLIVKQLQDGKKVELPGIGTLSPQQKKSDMDPISGKIYPDRMSVAFSKELTGENALIESIAAKECVDGNVAQRMLKNYVDALTDKLEIQGLHELPGIGNLVKKNGKFDFVAIDGLNIGQNNESGRPLDNIHIYKKDNEDDPFAIFDQPIFSHKEVSTEPVAPIQQTPIAPEPVEEPKSEMKVEEAKNEMETPHVNETPAETMQESVAEPAEADQETVAQEPDPTSVTEPIDVKEDHESKLQAEPEPQKGKETPVSATRKAVFSQLEQLDEMPVVPPTEEHEEKKHRKSWILWLILILLLGAGAYYYFLVYQPDKDASSIEADTLDISDEVYADAVSDNVTAGENVVNEDTTVAEVTEGSESTETSGDDEYQIPQNENLFTNNGDLIEYDERDIYVIRENLCQNMREYVTQFAAQRGYKAAAEPLMAEVKKYADEHLAENLDVNVYSVRRFIPYEDYVYEYRIPNIKQRKGNSALIKVQSELMDGITLNQMLDKVVEELGLEKAAAQAQAKKPAPAAQPQKPAKVSTSSLRGYDIIAGFYTNYNNALSMTNRLKEQGCDAYIIDRDNYYYVSMGSAATRTAAESMMKYIKTWYAGDVAIKKF